MKKILIFIYKKLNNCASRLLNSELFMDALSCLLLSVGSLTAMLALTALGGNVMLCFVAAAVSTAFIVMAIRRWWLALCAVLFLILVYLGYYFYIDRLDSLPLFWGSFFDWIFSGAYYEEGITHNGFLSAIGVILVFAATLAMFMLIRKWFNFTAMVLLQFAVLIFSYIMMDTDLSAALCLSAAGLIVLLPRVYAKKLIEMSELSGESKERVRVSRARMQAVAIPAAAVSIVLSLALVPQDTRGWRSHRLIGLISDVTTLMSGPFRGSEGWASGFDLHQFGYNSETGTLGGPVTLTDKRYLTAWAKRPVLLKGKVLDYYDGHSWGESFSAGDLRLQSRLWNNIRKTTFDLDKPLGSQEAQSLYTQLTHEMDINIIGYDYRINTLFSPEHMIDLISRDIQIENLELYFNKRSEIYFHSYINFPNYTVRARVWNTKMYNFDELFTQLETYTTDKSGYSEAVNLYTQLPDNLPDEVRQTARFITEGIDSPYLKARAISNWLAQNADYTLDPVIPPEDMDFTAHFLETRKGYCVYFATAMTVLARCAGLPARYVQGLALEAVVEGTFYQATGKTAHAWSEVYFEGIGWLPIDPLNWSEQFISANTSVSSTSSTARVPENNPQINSTISQTEQNNDGGSAVFIWIALILLLALYGLFMWALWAGPRYCARIWTHDNLRQRLPDRASQLNALYNDILLLLSLQGMNVRTSETLISFPKRVDRNIMVDGVTLTEIARYLMRLHFSDAVPEDNEIERACLYHQRLDVLTFELLGKVRYLFRRVLTGKDFRVRS